MTNIHEKHERHEKINGKIWHGEECYQIQGAVFDAFSFAPYF
jgi:hypothetical protein